MTVKTYKRVIEHFTLNCEGLARTQNDSIRCAMYRGEHGEQIQQVLWSYQSPLAVRTAQGVLINSRLIGYSMTTSKQMGQLRYQCSVNHIPYREVRFPDNNSSVWGAERIGDANSRFPNSSECAELFNQVFNENSGD